MPILLGMKSTSEGPGGEFLRTWGDAPADDGSWEGGGWRSTSLGHPCCRPSYSPFTEFYQSSYTCVQSHPHTPGIWEPVPACSRRWTILILGMNKGQRRTELDPESLKISTANTYGVLRSVPGCWALYAKCFTNGFFKFPQLSHSVNRSLTRDMEAKQLIQQMVSTAPPFHTTPALQPI